MSIRTQLILLTIGLASISVILTILGISGITMQRRTLVKFYDEGFRPAERSLQIGRNMLAIRGNVYKYLLITETKPATRSAIDAMLLKSDSLVVGIDTSELPAEQKSALTTMQSAWGNYKSAVEDVLAQADAGRQDSSLRSIANGQAHHCRKTMDALVDSITKTSSDKVKELNATGESTSRRALTLFLVVTGVGLSIGALSSYLLIRKLMKSIQQPLAQTRDVLGRVANKDFSVRLAMNTQNEFGEMGRSLDTTLDMLGGILSGIQENSNELNGTAEEMSAVSREMSHLTHRTSERAGSVAVAADNMSRAMHSVSAASEQSSANISMVSAAVEELSSSIAEIARSAETTRAEMNSAVLSVETAVGNMDEMDKAGKQIGNVVELIVEIADQTKLLALNATIEAARAGESGKGFAVVAGEVKNLARSTAEATEEIRKQIEAMQASTHTAVDGIRTVRKMIDQAAGNVMSIASAVEEQSIATRDIASNVDQASTGVKEITRNVAQAATSAKSIAEDVEAVRADNHGVDQSSAQVRETAGSLSRMAAVLRATSSEFKVR